MLVRWLCHDALGDFGLLPLLFSASDRNFLKYSSRLSKYGDRAEINKNTSRPVTTSTGIVMAKAVTGGVCVQSGMKRSADHWSHVLTLPHSVSLHP